MDAASLIDYGIVRAQLDREPRGAWRVEVRCRHGAPQVVRVHPILDGRPFPTLFWLTCPYLSRQVSGLESAGWISLLERRVKEDEALRRRVEEAHASYAKERLGLLSAAERGHLEASGQLTSLTMRGIGGTRDVRRVKCLHLHVAHALARSNPLGEEVLRSLVCTDCDGKERICSTADAGSRSRVNR